MALSVQNNKEIFRGFIIFFSRGFSKFYENKSFLETKFCNYGVGSWELPQKCWARSVIVLTFKLDTNQHMKIKSKA